MMKELFTNLREVQVPVTVKKRIVIFLLILTVGLFGMTATAQAQNTPINAMEIFLWEDHMNMRSTITVYGMLNPEEAELPVTVNFGFLEGFEFKTLLHIDVETGESLSEIEPETSTQEFEEATIVNYTFTLTESYVFFAGFEVAGGIFDWETEMGDSPLAHFAYLPPNDLDWLTVGFISPSPALIGAGADVEFLEIMEQGELYGITRFDVPEGELQDFVVAFGSRAARDAAIEAAIAEEEAAAEAQRLAEDHWYRFTVWATSPVGLVVLGTAVVVLSIVAVVIVLVLKQRNNNRFDDDSSDNFTYVPDDDVFNNESADLFVGDSDARKAE